MNLLRSLQQQENWTQTWPENFVQRTEPLRRLDPHTHEYQLGEKRAGVQNKLLLNLRAKATITLILGLRRSKQNGRVPLKKH